MNSSFFRLILFSLLGIVLTSTFRHSDGILSWTGLIAALAPLIFYHFMLWRKSRISSTEIDSVYYFGFLITVITLVATAVSLGLSPKNTLNLQWILLQFGLGLIATGYALFARLHLLSKINSTADGDLADSTERLARAVHKVAGEFDTAGFKVAAFVESTERRLANLQDNLSSTFQFAEKNFNESLARSSAQSLDRVTSVINQATESLAAAVLNVKDQINRIQTEAEGICFTKASQRISEFSLQMESSIKSISNSVSEASKESAASVTELSSIFRKTSRLASDISQKLLKLDNLSSLTDAISNATNAIHSISITSSEAVDALSSLASKSAIAEQSIRVGVINPLENIHFANSLANAETSIISAGKIVNESLVNLNLTLSPVNEVLSSLVSRFESSLASTNIIGEEVKNLSNSVSEFESSVRSAACVIAEAGATAGNIKAFDVGIHAASTRLIDSLDKLGAQSDRLSIHLDKATPSLDKAIGSAASGLGTIDSRLAALDDLASSARMASQQIQAAALSISANPDLTLPTPTYIPKQSSSSDQYNIG